MTFMPKIDRRSFAIGSAAAGAGLMLGFRLPLGAGAARAADGAAEIDAWVVIRPDDSVVVRIARSEMGQGTLTGLAQLVAEELDCDWSKVTTELPTPGQNLARGRVWGDFNTVGSQGIRNSQDYMRKGGATARAMLVQAAAGAWNVPASECSAANGVISHQPSGRTTTFGKVADAAAKLAPPKDVTLKAEKDWKIAGKPLKRLDTPDKLLGKTIYGIDVRLPGMLYAAISSCPVFGGTLKSYDEAKVRGMPGMRQVMRVGDDAVAVVADSWWRAKSALAALPVVWDEGENANVSSATIAGFLKEGLDAEQAIVGNKAGDVGAALSGAAKVVEAVYSFPYRIHACMEPMNATALYAAERCQVWCPTQNAEAALATAVKTSGLPPTQCDIYKTYLGGGFGRRGEEAERDYVLQAVTIAMQLPGTPIKLVWSREEDTTHDRYHPITQCRMRGALDADNRLVGLHMRISGQSITAAYAPDHLQNGKDPRTFSTLNPGGPEGAFGYAIPNLLIDHAMRNPPIPPGSWRAVNANQNAFYVESFMDELAHAAGEDPLAFRLKYLKPKHAAALKAAAEKAGYGAPAPPGVYRGLAQMMGDASYVAACAEVSVDNGRVKVHRMIGAINSGRAVNPEQIARQVEGSFVYGLSSLLYGECTVKDGRIEQTNFDTWRVMRIDDMPKVETVLMPDGEAWGGVGEPLTPLAAPAVLNAVFAATGKRIRSIPIKPGDLRSA
ncbi:MAG TPA: molybdopterin cofactor-binding domain-containing protein [Xanthobacteraceae bacterium]|nr:molybdopterin cofactor-binding domain-containing protein [Xanthobacteraceae bacterium]